MITLTSLTLLAASQDEAIRKHLAEIARLDALVAELRAENERLRGLLAREHACHSARSSTDTIGMGAGWVRCEHSQCLATIDAPLVAASAWTVDARGWWFCPAHPQKETP